MKQVAMLGDAHRRPGTDPGPAEATACNPCPPRDGRLAGLSNKFRVRTKAKSQLRHMLRRGPAQRSGKVSLRKGPLPELRAQARVKEEKEDRDISERGDSAWKKGRAEKAQGPRSSEFGPGGESPGTVCLRR